MSSTLPKEIMDKIEDIQKMYPPAKVVFIHYSQIIEQKDKEISILKREINSLKQKLSPL